MLAKIWIGDFYGRIEAVENITAREVVRQRLATDGKGELPPVVRVNLSPEQYQSTFQVGAVIRLRARLMPPAGPTLPGGYDFARRAWFQQIGATGSALGTVTLIEPARTNAMFSVKRAQLTQHILASMPPDAGAIGAALVTGDQGHISEADAQAMRDSGLAHLLSISGLHVTAVVGFIFIAVSRLLSLSSWLALRISVPICAAAAAAMGALAYTHDTFLHCRASGARGTGVGQGGAYPAFGCIWRVDCPAILARRIGRAKLSTQLRRRCHDCHPSRTVTGEALYRKAGRADALSICPGCCFTCAHRARYRNNLGPDRVVSFS